MGLQDSLSCEGFTVDVVYFNIMLQETQTDKTYLFDMPHVSGFIIGIQILSAEVIFGLNIVDVRLGYCLDG